MITDGDVRDPKVYPGSPSPVIIVLTWRGVGADVVGTEEVIFVTRKYPDFKVLSFVSDTQRRNARQEGGGTYSEEGPAPGTGKMNFFKNQRSFENNKNRAFSVSMYIGFAVKLTYGGKNIDEAHTNTQYRTPQPSRCFPRHLHEFRVIEFFPISK